MLRKRIGWLYHCAQGGCGPRIYANSDDSEICDNGMLDAPKVSDVLSIAESLRVNNVTMNRRADV